MKRKQTLRLLQSFRVPIYVTIFIVLTSLNNHRYVENRFFVLFFPLSSFYFLLSLSKTLMAYWAAVIFLIFLVYI